MAKRSASSKKLTFIDIVMNAEAEEIKRAYEARIEVDKLLAERNEAYRGIARLEEQIEEVVGEKGVFVFDPPPCPVAGLESASPRRKRQKTSGSKSTPADKSTGSAETKTKSDASKDPTIRRNTNSTGDKTAGTQKNTETAATDGTNSGNSAATT